jgi:hypothetical protein
MVSINEAETGLLRKYFPKIFNLLYFSVEDAPSHKDDLSPIDIQSSSDHEVTSSSAQSSKSSNYVVESKSASARLR